MDEVRDALFVIDNDKAPGSNGYGSYFFKATWDITGFDLFRAVDEFFRNCRLLKQWNHSIIALVPSISILFRSS